MGLRYSAGEDEVAVQRGVEALTKQGWEVDGERMGVKKTYYFRSYFKAIVRLPACPFGLSVCTNNVELCQYDCSGELGQEAPRCNDGCRYASRCLDVVC